VRSNPQIKLLKEKPETDTSKQLAVSDYRPLVSDIKVKDAQKMASNVLVYTDSLNIAVIRNLDKAGIKSIFDIGIHLLKEVAGPNIILLKQYVTAIKAYQTKLKKATLNVYIMADNYSVVTQFQAYCDPSWKITSLSKTPPKDGDGDLINSMSEIQIMSVLPALILDFNRPSDRYIYLMHRNHRDLSYFNEINGKEWSLLP
jgi:hypothetical protein